MIFCIGVRKALNGGQNLTAFLENIQKLKMGAPFNLTVDIYEKMIVNLSTVGA